MNSSTIEAITIGTEPFELQHLSSDSPELTDEVITDFANTFRFIFCNPPYGQYLFYPSVGKPISPQEVFGTDQPYVDLQTLDEYKIDSYPKHPETGEKAKFWQDPQVTLKRFRAKFRKTAFLTLLRSPSSRQILGACFGYRASLIEAFENEEWENPFHYSRVEDQKFFRDKSTLLEQIEKTLEEAPDSTTEVFCYNCIFVDPALQGKGLGLVMKRHFLSALPKELHSLLTICEMIAGTGVYKMAEKIGITAVPGILSETFSRTESQGVIMITTLKQYIEGIEKLAASK